MARIDYATTDHLSDKGKDIMEKNGHKNLFKILAYSESHLHNYCRLGGAILDVHEREPILKSSPIWSVPNLILTPHVSSDDDVTYVPRTLDLVFGNLGRLLAGKRLVNRVDPVLGY